MNSRHGDLDRAVTRGGPTMEFVERSGVDNLASIRPCAYCGKPAAYRDLAGQPAHDMCWRVLRREAARQDQHLRK
jgi:hypothetical protein